MKSAGLGYKGCRNDWRALTGEGSHKIWKEIAGWNEK